MIPGIMIQRNKRCSLMNRWASPQDWTASTISFSKALIWMVNIRKDNGEWKMVNGEWGLASGKWG